jgi:hypothetical protein
MIQQKGHTLVVAEDVPAVGKACTTNRGVWVGTGCWRRGRARDGVVG